MNDLYIFVNPLVPFSDEIEHLMAFCRSSLQTPVRLQVIPLVNLQVIEQFVEQWQLQDSLAMRNLLLKRAYQIALDYKAAQLQGKRYARAFLRLVQATNQPYTPELARELFAQTGGDCEVFSEDRKSPLCKQLFEQDQHLACDMQVKQVDTIIWYSNQFDEQTSYLIKGAENIRHLPQLLNQLDFKQSNHS